MNDPTKKSLYTELYRCIKNINIKKLNEEDKNELLNFFMITQNPLIRNHIAMIFSDIQYNKSVPFILKKIMDKNISEDNGTLVFALQNLDCKCYFISFINIICTMDYEARLMAYEIIEKYSDSISISTRRVSLKKLQEYRLKIEASSEDKGENSRLHFIEKIIELLKI